MILKASERGGAKQLALHLLKTEENEHVELHEVRGFIAEDLIGALHEAYAVSRGTRCRKFLFSLSLSPPESEDVPIEAFEEAIRRIEEKLGLEGQPRAVVFHEKEGRRHAHCVWSKIDARAMKARPLPHFKRKLNAVARELFIEHGWKLPKGFLHDQARDPLTFTRAEWQQAKRAKQDPKALKAMFQECWAVSDSKAAFQNMLRERGYYLARGDRRGFVAVDYRGEVYSLSRYIGVKSKDLKARLGEPETLQSIQDAKVWLAERMNQTLRRHVFQLEKQHERQMGLLEAKRRDMAKAHQEARRSLTERQAQRWEAEERERAARLPRGFQAVWFWVTGKSKVIRAENEKEIERARQRDRAELQAMRTEQLTERRTLQTKIRTLRQTHSQEVAELHADIAHYMAMKGKRTTNLSESYERARGPIIKGERERDQDADYDPEI